MYNSVIKTVSEKHLKVKHVSHVAVHFLQMLKSWTCTDFCKSKHLMNNLHLKHNYAHVSWISRALWFLWHGWITESSYKNGIPNVPEFAKFWMNMDLILSCILFKYESCLFCGWMNGAVARFCLLLILAVILAPHLNLWVLEHINNL